MANIPISDITQQVNTLISSDLLLVSKHVSGEQYYSAKLRYDNLVDQIKSNIIGDISGGNEKFDVLYDDQVGTLNSETGVITFGNNASRNPYTGLIFVFEKNGKRSTIFKTNHEIDIALETSGHLVLDKLLSGTAPVVGNGMTLGMTNGTTNFGLGGHGAGYNSGIGGTGNYGTPVGGGIGGRVGFDTGIGVTSDGTKSGIQADISQVTGVELTAITNTTVTLNDITTIVAIYGIILKGGSSTDNDLDYDTIRTETLKWKNLGTGNTNGPFKAYLDTTQEKYYTATRNEIVYLSGNVDNTSSEEIAEIYVIPNNSESEIKLTIVKGYQTTRAEFHSTLFLNKGDRLYVWCDHITSNVPDVSITSFEFHGVGGNGTSTGGNGGVIDGTVLVPQQTFDSGNLSDWSYTVQNDCMLYIHIDAYIKTFLISNSPLTFNAPGENGHLLAPVKKGSTITAQSTTDIDLSTYNLYVTEYKLNSIAPQFPAPDYDSNAALLTSGSVISRNGYVYLDNSLGANNHWIAVNGITVFRVGDNGAVNITGISIVPVSKDDVVTFDNKSTCYFIPCKTASQPDCTSYVIESKKGTVTDGAVTHSWWYRKYSDGWLEQGGCYNKNLQTDTVYDFTLPKSYGLDLSYQVILTPLSNGTVTSEPTVLCCKKVDGQNIKIINDHYSTNNIGCCWETKGYIG